MTFHTFGDDVCYSVDWLSEKSPETYSCDDEDEESAAATDDGQSSKWPPSQEIYRMWSRVKFCLIINAEENFSSSSHGMGAEVGIETIVGRTSGEACRGSTISSSLSLSLHSAFCNSSSIPLQLPPLYAFAVTVCVSDHVDHLKTWSDGQELTVDR